MKQSVVTHHCTAWCRSHRATSRWIAGSVCRRRSGRGGNRVAGATSAWLAVPLPPLQPDQETAGPHDRHRMAAEPRPQAPLIPIPAHFPCGLFMELLQRVSPMGRADRYFERGRGRQVAPSILPLVRLAPCVPFPSSQPTCRCPWRDTRHPRTAMHFLRRHPFVPCRQRMVRHCQRGRACSSWSARCTGLVAVRRGLTRKSARTPTTYRAWPASSPARKLGSSPSSAPATWPADRCHNK
jgi:hypothetical protein